MVGCQFFQKVTATVAITGMLISLTPALTLAASILKNGDQVEGVISSNSPTFRFRNESRTGTPFQRASGEEYVFNAQQGDTIQVSVQAKDGNNLSPVLVLTSSQTGRQVAYDDTSNSIEYQVPVSGEYRLLVLGQNYSKGRYTLSLSGLSNSGVSQNPSNQTTSSRSADQRRRFLRNEYGLRLLDNCPADTSSLVTATFNEYGQTSTYCAYPNRALKAGQYTYNPATNDLQPGASVGQNSSNQATASDSRRQTLQNDFGLTVLDSCPASTSNLVVVNFADNSSQTYTYCANPNRVFSAGQYTYNPDTRNLEAGNSKPQQQCNVQVGGICLVK